eukprot:PhM_4_TR8166/c0_g1_i1/m.12154/K09548/PFDN1; prefoldin subunit 1
MSNNKLTAQQQELVEREKSLQEQEEGIQRLKSQFHHLQQQITAMEKEKKRAYITAQELGKLPESTPCYRALGRAFVMTAVPTLKTEEAEREKTCATEITALEARKTQLSGTIQNQQTSFQSQYKEFMEAVQAMNGSVTVKK